MHDATRRQLAAVMFTDIVGYTATMGANEQAGLQARTKYQEILKREHEAFAGRIVSLQGDGALSVFASSVEAIRCAIEIQRQCRLPPEVPLRIGIHAGDVVVDTNNVIGDAVNIASRIESFAIAGSVLVSDTVYDQARNQQGLSFETLGEFRLKNVSRPFEVFAVAHPDVVLPSRDVIEGKGERLRRLPASLPQPATPIIGRDADVVAIDALLEQRRVVTITGPGGVGKTRLAVEVGHRLPKRFEDGVAFVPLARVTAVEDLVPALAEALDVKEAEGRTTADGVAALIGEMRALLILDNLEQVIAAAPDIAALLERCPHLHLLITSQTPLRISLEQQYPLAPLALPLSDEHAQGATTMGYPSVTLFVERARAARGGFELTDENATAISAICRRLDGLPLAIELAAARVGLLAPNALLERLDHALALLTIGARDAPQRQQTLRATIDWSHSLLSPSEQRLFRRMAIFRGSASVEDVEAVCASDDAVLDDLGSLAEKSLIQVDSASGRITMLQTIREYAGQALNDAAEEEPLAIAHARHFARVAMDIRAGIEGGDQVRSIERAMLDEIDLRAALDVLLARATEGDVEAADLGMGICADLLWLWHIRARHLSARAYTNAFLRLRASASRTARRAEALLTAALASGTLGDSTAAADASLESFLIAKEINDGRVMASAAYMRGFYRLGFDVAEAHEWTQQAMELSRVNGLTFEGARAALIDGIVSLTSGDVATAEKRFIEALAQQRSIKEIQGSALSLSSLALLRAMGGDATGAIKLYGHSLLAFEQVGDRAEEARVLTEMGGVHLGAHDAAAAKHALLESVRAHDDVGSVRGMGISLIGLAAVVAIEGRAADAVQIATAADLLASEEGILVAYSENAPGRQYVEEARASLSSGDLNEAEQAGRRLSLAEALELARREGSAV